MLKASPRLLAVMTISAASAYAAWLPPPAIAQTDDSVTITTTLLPCPSAEENVDNLKASVKCHEDRIRELDQAQKMLRDNFSTVFNRLDALEKEMKGPRKTVELIPAAKMAITTAYWSGGDRNRRFTCAPLEEKPGHTIWGAKLGEAERLRPTYTVGNRVVEGNLAKFGARSTRGCAPSPYCDSHGEYCEAQARSRGCYINTEWLQWLRRRAEAPENYETVCQ